MSQALQCYPSAMAKDVPMEWLFSALLFDTRLALWENETFENPGNWIRRLTSTHTIARSYLSRPGERLIWQLLGVKFFPSLSPSFRASVPFSIENSRNDNNITYGWDGKSKEEVERPSRATAVQQGSQRIHSSFGRLHDIPDIERGKKQRASGE
jgi:hypothetical protein